MKLINFFGVLSDCGWANNIFISTIFTFDNALNESAYSTTKVSTVNDSQELILGYALINNSAIACSYSVSTPCYIDPATTFQTTTTLWSDAERTIPQLSAEYSDGLYHRHWNGSSFQGGDPEGFC